MMELNYRFSTAGGRHEVVRVREEQGGFRFAPSAESVADGAERGHNARKKGARALSSASAFLLQLSRHRIIDLIRYYAYRLLEIFLPEGYPDSVTPDYAKFQAWDTIQALCSYLRGILCTTALLKAMGVGDATATATGAAVSWITRDGAAMMASLVFATSVGTAFDRHTKSWRFFADIVNDMALTVELTAPMWGKAYIVPVVAASVLKAVVGVTVGSVRASITQHFARRGNLADVAAKENSQETVVSLLGLVLGSVIASYFGEDEVFVWTSFIVLTIVHVFANYIGIRALQLNTLNPQRLTILVDDMFQTDGGNISLPQHCTAPTPTMVADVESLLWFRHDHVSIRLGFVPPTRQFDAVIADEQSMLMIRESSVFLVPHTSTSESELASLYLAALLLRRHLLARHADRRAVMACASAEELRSLWFKSVDAARASQTDFESLLEHSGWELRYLIRDQGQRFSSEKRE